MSVVNGIHKRVTQPDDWSCIAACSAMVAGMEIADFIQFIGHDGSEINKETSHHPDGRKGFSDWEMCRFLIYHGYNLGAEIHLTKSYIHSDANELYAPIGEFRDKGWPKNEEWPYIEAKIVASPAIVTVKSERLSGCRHVVFWSGKSIFDPNPDVSEKRPISDYHLLGWFTVAILEGFPWAEKEARQ